MKQFGLGRKDRVSRRNDVRTAVFRGRKLQSAMLTVWAVRTATGIPRLTIQVSRRLGDAVRRNRWKRLIRESFRLNKHRLPSSADLVIAPRMPPAKLKMQDVARELMNLISKL